MMVNGQMTKLTASALTCMLMEQSTMATGGMICSMAREWRLGLTVQGTTESTLTGVNMASVPINGTTARSMQVNGRKTRFLASAYIRGLMDASMRVNGSITTWRVKASMCGTTAVVMKVNTRMIKSMVSAYIPGQMAVVTRATGGRVSNTAWAHTLSLRMERSSMVSGKTAKE